MIYGTREKARGKLLLKLRDVGVLIEMHMSQSEFKQTGPGI